MAEKKIFHKTPAGPGLVPAQFVVINVDGLDRMVPLPKALNFLNSSLTSNTSDLQSKVEALQKSLTWIEVDSR